MPFGNRQSTILFFLSREENSKGEAHKTGLPYADFFGSFLVRKQERNMFSVILTTVYRLLSSQKATALAAATFRESTP